MPHLQQITKKKHYPKGNEEKRKLRQKAYLSTVWRKKRKIFLMNHPMCEICGKRATVDIHHIKSPFDFEHNKIDWDLMLDEDNLKALCKECHGELHNEQKKNKYENELRNEIREEDDNIGSDIIII